MNLRAPSELSSKGHTVLKGEAHSKLDLYVLSEAVLASEYGSYIVGNGKSGLSQFVAQRLAAKFRMDPNVLGSGSPHGYTRLFNKRSELISVPPRPPGLKIQQASTVWCDLLESEASGPISGPGGPETQKVVPERLLNNLAYMVCCIHGSGNVKRNGLR